MSSVQQFPWQQVVERERDWCTSLVDAYGAAGIILSESTIDLRALFVMSHETAIATGVLPLRIHEGTLFVASARPLSPDVLTALQSHARMSVVSVLATGPLLRGAIDAAYAAMAKGAAVLVGLRAAVRGVHLELVRPAPVRLEAIVSWLEPVAQV